MAELYLFPELMAACFQVRFGRSPGKTTNKIHDHPNTDVLFMSIIDDPCCKECSLTHTHTHTYTCSTTILASPAVYGL